MGRQLLSDNSSIIVTQSKAFNFPQLFIDYFRPNIYNSSTKIMVGVVQLVEQQIVILFVVGSSPIVHPIFKSLL